MKKICFFVLQITLLLIVPRTMAERGTKTSIGDISNYVLNQLNENSPDSAGKMVTARITFFCDLRKIWGSGRGYFDETTDSIQIEGLTGNNRAQLLGDISRRLHLVNPTSTGVYSTTLTLLVKAGDTLSYTYRAYPPDHFYNDGYETGQQRTIIFPMNDTTFSLPYTVPAINAVDRTTRDIYCRISVSIRQGMTNGINGELIPLNKVQWIGLKGEIPEFGSWGGNWTPADTLIQPGYKFPSLIILNDNGVDGDLVAGDYIWSKLFLFPKGTIASWVNFKLGVMYPGADTICGGIQPLNNEKYYTYGMTHVLVIYQSKGDTIAYNISFGAYPYMCRCGIKEIDTQPFGSRGQLQFSLMQNYPNPFNPTTQIRFSLPAPEHVVLKIYSVLGKEVVTLLDTDVHPGTFETTFEPVGLPTGIYYYRLTAGNYSATKKMMYVK